MSKRPGDSEDSPRKRNTPVIDLTTPGIPIISTFIPTISPPIHIPSDDDYDSLIMEEDEEDEHLDHFQRGYYHDEDEDEVVISSTDDDFSNIPTTSTDEQYARILQESELFIPSVYDTFLGGGFGMFNYYNVGSSRSRIMSAINAINNESSSRLTPRDFMPDVSFDDSYESLLAISERIGAATKQGLTAKEFNKLPRKKYKQGEDGMSTNCAICLEDYSNNEKLVGISECTHYFHEKCLKPWLKGNMICPMY